MNQKIIGNQKIFYDELDSTNQKAKELLKEGKVQNGTIIVADSQLAGKGRMGRVWASPKGVGIFMSIIVCPDIAINQIPKLTLISGLAVCHTIKKICGGQSRIKWPNDILINNKKVCGILCELVGNGTGKNFVVIGIGINVNQKCFPKDLPHATSLKIEYNQTFSREKIIDQFAEVFDKMYNTYLVEKSLEPFIQDYAQLCINTGKEVYISKSGDELEKVTVIKINNEGALEVIDENDNMYEIHSGEVSVRGLYGYV